MRELPPSGSVSSSGDPSVEPVAFSSGVPWGRVTNRRSLLAAGAGIAAAASLPACSSSRSRQPPGHRPEAPRSQRAEDALSGLTDQRSSVDPISSQERAARRRRLGLLLQSRGIDALLLEGGSTMTYLAGVRWSRSERFFGMVALANGSHFWICPAFEESRARAQIDGTSLSGSEVGPGGEVVAWQEDEYAFAPLAAALSRRGVDRIGIEPSLRHVFAQRLSDEFGAEKIDGSAGAALLLGLRARKDAHELAILRRANELTQLAIQAVARALEPGLAGSEIAALVNLAHERLGLRSPWNLSLIGPAAALPHGEPDERRLSRGDVVLVDAGGELHGYQSDNTRSWVFDGQPTAEVARAWDAVRDAQRSAYEALRPGVVCAEIDRTARRAIEARGYPSGYEVFTHRLGHGIGLDGHEDPYFDSGSSVVLESGMTLSNEPGLYFPGRFGVRIEDIVVVTEDGADHFGEWQSGPTSPA